jgi:hypothetical protein
MQLHCKKVGGFSVPSQDVTITKLSLWDGETANLFLQRIVENYCLELEMN